MQKKKEKILRLKNKYNGTEVFTKNYEDVVIMDNMEFIRVYDVDNPQRTYLANKESFTIISR